MRIAVVLFSGLALLASCVKKTSTDPVPGIEYKSADFFGITKVGNDSANVTISYEDGDGDLFTNDNTSNLYIDVFYYNTDSAKYIKDRPLPISYSVRQPASGYYAGKPVKGDVTIPLKEYRSSAKRKIVKFSLFMRDSKGHLSNSVSSPGYTLSL